MLPTQRVAWVEGMLMEPQHFQQQERYLENIFHSRISELGAWNWGLSELEIDHELLAQGKFAIRRAKGVFPDGTVFSMPDRDPLPAPLDLHDLQNQLVCLAIPLDMPGNAYIDLTGNGGGSRYRAVDTEVQDRNLLPSFAEGNTRQAMLQLGALQSRLCLKESCCGAESVLPIAMLGERRPEGGITLDGKILPVMIDFRATGWLYDVTAELLGLISQRLVTVRLPDAHYSGGGMNEVLELMLLQLLNEYYLSIHHLLSQPKVHPERLFLMLLGLLGRLTIIPGSESLHERQDLRYLHEQPGQCFFALFAALRRALSLVIESPAVALPFRSNGNNLYLCQNDAQLHIERLIFAVSADVPGDMLRSDFPAQIKLGPVEKIAKLVELQLPGARLNAMSAPPRHIPYYPDSVYFEVEPTDPLCQEMLSCAAIALSIVGDFPSLRFNVWGLRPGRGR